MSSGQTLTFAGIGLLALALVAPSLPGGRSTSRDGAPAEAPPAAFSARSPARGPGELVRAPDGHFYADAHVNGANVRFMVDTGASIAVLTRTDAQRAGIALDGPQAMAQGVGGPVAVTPVTIDRLVIGPREAAGVRAAVADELGVSLLGQNVLAQFGSVEIRGDRMILR